VRLHNRSSARFAAYLLIIFGLAPLLLVSACSDTTPTTDRGRRPATAVPPAANPPLTPEPELGIVIDTNFEVVEVQPGSAAERAGIQQGDLLEMLAGESFEEPVEAFVAFRDYIQANPGKAVPLSLKRKGQPVTLDVVPALPIASPGGPTPTPLPDEWAHL
jgi:S1-C subfamily serine protease